MSRAQFRKTALLKRQFTSARHLYGAAISNALPSLECIPQYPHNEQWRFTSRFIGPRNYYSFATKLAALSETDRPLGLSVPTSNGIISREFCSHLSKEEEENADTPLSPTEAKIQEYLQSHRFPELEAFLQELLASSCSSSDEVVLRMETFNAVIGECSFWKNQKERGYMAERFLDIMMKFHAAGKLDMAPTVQPFICCIMVWGRSNHRNRATRAEAILEQVERLVAEDDDGTLDISLDTKLYTAAMSVHARQGNIESSNAIFNRMIQEFENSRNECLRPDCYSVGSLILACACSVNKDTGEVAEKILNQAHSMYQSGIMTERVDAHCYNSTILAYARLGNMQKAEQILERMYDDYQNGNTDARPNTDSFSQILRCCANQETEGGAKRSEAVLKRMHKLHDENILPVRPDSRSYAFVINACANHGKPKDAERILHQMYKDYKENGNDSAQPNARIFYCVIKAWIKSGDRKDVARAEEIFRHMFELKRNGTLDILPDTRCYTVLLQAWAKLRDTARAQALFEMMKEDCQSGKNPRVKLHTDIFIAIIKLVYDTRAPNAGEKADGLLADAEKFGLKPGVTLLVMAQRCWRLEEGNPQARQRIDELEDAMESLRNAAKVKNDGNRGI